MKITVTTGVTVAILAVIGVLSFDTTTDVGYTEGASTSTAEPTQTNTPTGNTSNLEVTVPAQAPDGQDSAGNPVEYSPEQMFDGDPGTCWRMRGDGSGQYIQISFSSSQTITSIGLINGYAKIDPVSGVDRYAQERQITSVSWFFDDGTSLYQELDPNTEQLQRIEVGSPISTTTIRMQISSTTLPGDPNYDYTAVSEIDIERQ
ncbi:MAG: NADase-type glycan-binding domain-containing protein [Nocardioidaceae bacterium]